MKPMIPKDRKIKSTLLWRAVRRSTASRQSQPPAVVKSNMFFKEYRSEAKTAPKNWNQSVHISWTRLASFCHLGVISNPLIVPKFHNETHDPKGQENTIYTIVQGRETFYRRHTVPVISCSEVKYVLKRVSFGSKDCTKELKPECAYFLGQTS